ncbi:MAG: hypothetical protein ACPIOQ_62990, partial [Promethearchaeia archaeon]
GFSLWQNLRPPRQRLGRVRGDPRGQRAAMAILPYVVGILVLGAAAMAPHAADGTAFVAKPYVPLRFSGPRRLGQRHARRKEVPADFNSLRGETSRLQSSASEASSNHPGAHGAHVNAEEGDEVHEVSPRTTRWNPPAGNSAQRRAVSETGAPVTNLAAQGVPNAIESSHSMMEEAAQLMAEAGMQVNKTRAKEGVDATAVMTRVRHLLALAEVKAQPHSEGGAVKRVPESSEKLREETRSLQAELEEIQLELISLKRSVPLRTEVQTRRWEPPVGYVPRKSTTGVEDDHVDASVGHDGGTDASSTAVDDRTSAMKIETDRMVTSKPDMQGAATPSAGKIWEPPVGYVPSRAMAAPAGKTERTKRPPEAEASEGMSMPAKQWEPPLVAV